MSTILVTGASRGIGLATALAFARVSRKSDRLFKNSAPKLVRIPSSSTE